MKMKNTKSARNMKIKILQKIKVLQKAAVALPLPASLVIILAVTTQMYGSAAYAYDNGNYDSNINMNIWQHDAQASREMGKEEVQMMRDRRINSMVSDPDDFKFHDDQNEQNASQHKRKLAKKKHNAVTAEK